MLQFVINNGSRFTAVEEARMAIAGGCRWIQLPASVVGDDMKALKAVANEIIPVCRENDAFLVIEDNVGLVDELKVHGVFLRDNARATVMEAREKLGAHAVIGVYAETFDEIAALQGLDVDYVAVPEPNDCNTVALSIPVDDKYAALIKKMRDGGIDFHLVAIGEFSLEMLPRLLASGCAGVAMSSSISGAGSPEEAAARIIEVLDRARFGD